MPDVICPKTSQPRPVVCVPLAKWDDDMTQQTVICYDCRMVQPGGAAAVRAFFDQVKG